MCDGSWVAIVTFVAVGVTVVVSVMVAVGFVIIVRGVTQRSLSIVEVDGNQVRGGPVEMIGSASFDLLR